MYLQKIYDCARILQYAWPTLLTCDKSFYITLNSRSWYTFRTSAQVSVLIVHFESVGSWNCQTLYKGGPSQLVNYIISCSFSLFFFWGGGRGGVRLLSYPTSFCPALWCTHHVFLYIVFMFINRQLSISRDVQSCDCIFGFNRKEKSWIRDLQCKFWVLIS